MVGERRFAGNDVGVRFIYPNPDQPTRYVIVSTGVNAAVIRAASNLPEFLPDWFVYNQATVRLGMDVQPQRLAELIRTLAGIQSEGGGGSVPWESGLHLQCRYPQIY